ncbi:MAG: hypothetical protein ABIQ89_00090 [Candidatus Saccharimonadales bacterium]
MAGEIQNDYTPQRDLNDESHLPPELREELEAFRADLLDTTDGSLRATSLGQTPLDDEHKVVEGMG